MIFLGFDPGGKNKFGCAMLNPATKMIAATRAKSVEHALEWAVNKSLGEEVAAAGIDTLLFWQTTTAGWRGADEYLKDTYRECRNSVSSSNSLYGAMAVQGAVLAWKLREKWPTVFLTETHPKVLWHCIQKSVEYPRADLWQGEAPSTVGDWLLAEKLTGEIQNEDEFDAVLSAWAALQAYSKNWSRDLCLIKAVGQKSDNISLVPDVHYFWPE
jgi:Protein of unknown function (DUF429)